MHSSFLAIFLQFVVKRGIRAFSHPPYSPDLAPADFLFLKLQLRLKERDPKSFIDPADKKTESETEDPFLRPSIQS
jgi:hypothetical protein